MATSTRDILAEDGFYTNAEYPFEVQVLNENDEPVDISGRSLSWLMKKRRADSDADAIITKTNGAGLTITDGPNGLCLIEVHPADTNTGVNPGSYAQELKDLGNQRVLLHGLAILRGSVHLSS